MIVGELIHDTNGRTIYIATAFHGLMTFIPVFLFSEETGDLFSMKVIALTTAAVAIVYIIFTMIIRYFIYRTTDQSLDEVDPNNYLDHIGTMILKKQQLFQHQVKILKKVQHHQK